MTDTLAALSGALVGLVLGLVGGGGSIIAVPLLMYVVGVASPHVAIGTSAIAVSLSAAANLVNHARKGTVKWPCAASFSAAGIAGAWAGSSLALMVSGEKLLALFGGVMIAIGTIMLLRKDAEGNPDVRLSMATARQLLPFLLLIGFTVGALSGFFGIGGGFLIVPGLMLATGMPIANAVGTSLVAVTLFGATTASNYALVGPRRLAGCRAVHRRRTAGWGNRHLCRRQARSVQGHPRHGLCGFRDPDRALCLVERPGAPARLSNNIAYFAPSRFLTCAAYLIMAYKRTVTLSFCGI